MIARVTRFQADASRRQEAEQITNSQIAPGIAKLNGFNNMFVLLDDATGDGMVITLWDSNAAEEGSRATVGQRFSAIGSILTSQPSASEVYEVVSKR